MLFRRGPSHWQIKKSIQSPVVVCLPVGLFVWVFFFLNEMCNSSVLHIEIFIIHTHPLFSSPPFKRQGREDCIYLLILGKGKLRKRMYVYIASPHSCISCSHSHRLAQFICNAKKSIPEELSVMIHRHVCIQNVKNWSFLAHAFPAKVKQGSDLLSCVAFHVVNKCTFYDVCHI